MKLFYKLKAHLRYWLASFSKPKKKLLILKLDSIGDYILFRNFLKELKKSEQYSGYEITLCGNMWWKDLAERLDRNEIHEFIWVDYFKFSDWAYKNKIFSLVVNKKFETIIHPTYSRDEYSDQIVRFSGVKNCIGYDGDYINISKVHRSKFDVYYKQLIKGEDGIVFEFNRNRYFFENLLNKKLTNVKFEIEANAENDNSIVICPGAKDVERRWATSHFIELINKIKNREPEAIIILCGGKEDIKNGQEINSKLENKVLDLTGKITLVELISIFAKAKLIVTNDSGPFHLAAALGKRVICISNGTNYGRFTPYPSAINCTSTVIYSNEGKIEDINKIGVDTIVKTIYHA